MEGEHDSAILEEGFYSVINGFKITDLGGRTEVEKEIKTLQMAEQRGDLSKLHCFIFDLDHKPTGLKSTQLVRVLQWDRTCLENFLLGEKELYDTLADAGVKNLPSRGEFDSVIRDLAIGQLVELVSRETYSNVEPDNPGFRPKEIAGLDYDGIANLLVTRLSAIESQLRGMDAAAWQAKFVADAKEQEEVLKEQWGTSWRKLCNGKRLIDDLYRKFNINVSKVDLKIRVMRKMAAVESDDWQLIRGNYGRLLRKASKCFVLPRLSACNGMSPNSLFGINF